MEFDRTRIFILFWGVVMQDVAMEEYLIPNEITLTIFLSAALYSYCIVVEIP